MSTLVSASNICGVEIGEQVIDDVTITRLLNEENIPISSLYTCSALTSKQLETGLGNESFAVIGVLCSAPKHFQSQIRTQITICDIKDGAFIKVNLFDNVAKKLPAENFEGAVVLFLKPRINKTSCAVDKVAIDADTQKHVFHIGQAKYFSRCGVLCKSGEPCKMPIVKSSMLACKYHVRFVDTNHPDHTPLPERLPAPQYVLREVKEQTPLSSKMSEESLSLHSALAMQYVREQEALRKRQESTKRTLDLQEASSSTLMCSTSDGSSSSSFIPTKKVSKLGSLSTPSTLKSPPLTANNSSAIKPIVMTKELKEALKDSRVEFCNKPIQVPSNSSQQIRGMTIFASESLLKHRPTSAPASENVKNAATLKKSSPSMPLPKVSKDEIDELLSRKSTHHYEAMQSKRDEILKAVDKIAEKEEKMEAISKVQYIHISGFRCVECARFYERHESFCRNSKHSVQEVRLLKYFYECGNCFRTTSTLGIDYKFQKHAKSNNKTDSSNSNSKVDNDYYHINKTKSNLSTNYSAKSNNVSAGDRKESQEAPSGEKKEKVIEERLNDNVLVHTPSISCQCGKFMWRACGRNGTMEARSAKTASIHDSRLVLSTSEWVSSQDIGHLKYRERVLYQGEPNIN